MYKGIILYGYCGGYFGDSYENKRIENYGSDYIVARNMETGEPEFASFTNVEQLQNFIEENRLS